MSKIKLAVATLATAILAAATGLMAAPGIANASTYSTSNMTRAMNNTFYQNEGVVSEWDTVHFQVYSTYTASQIWINGHVTCGGGGAVPVSITWCGVGGGNGTAVLNVGLNWDVPSWDAYGLYERMNLLANHGGCTTKGTNSDVGEIDAWANWALTCEAGA
jgi:hypothetical protein